MQDDPMAFGGEDLLDDMHPRLQDAEGSVDDSMALGQPRLQDAEGLLGDSMALGKPKLQDAEQGEAVEVASWKGTSQTVCRDFGGIANYVEQVSSSPEALVEHVADAPPPVDDIAQASEGAIVLAADVPPTLAQQILADMGSMAQSRKDQKAAAKAEARAAAKTETKAKAKGKVKAAGQGEAHGKGPIEDKGKGQGKGKAEEKGKGKAIPASLGEPSLKRQRTTEPKVENEASLKRLRVRVPGAPSKSFKYKDEADKIIVVSAAEEYIREWKSRRTET